MDPGIKSRYWTQSADDHVRGLMLELLQSDHDRYRSIMSHIGEHLAHSLVPLVQGMDDDVDICLACSVEDADFLALGLLKQLEELMPRRRISFACFWNKQTFSPSGIEDLEIAPILKEYKEPVNPDRCILIVVKSIISGACVVATNIANLVSTINPMRILVVAPVMLENAEERLRSHFEESVSEKFEYLRFAIDTQKDHSGYVVPGVGGEVYVRYGLGSADEKNFVVPNIVVSRRRLIKAS